MESLEREPSEAQREKTNRRLGLKWCRVTWDKILGRMPKQHYETVAEKKTRTDRDNA